LQAFVFGQKPVSATKSRKKVRISVSQCRAKITHQNVRILLIISMYNSWTSCLGLIASLILFHF